MCVWVHTDAAMHALSHHYSSYLDNLRIIDRGIFDLLDFLM